MTQEFKSAAPRKQVGLSWVKWPVYVASGMVGMFLLYRALGLYNAAFASWGIARISGVCVQFVAAPLIGGFLRWFCNLTASVLVGLLPVVVLIVLTILQSLPTGLYFHPRVIEGMISHLRGQQRNRNLLAAESNDSGEIKHLVERHNKLKLSAEQLRTILLFSVAAFVVEAWIVWVARGGEASMTAALVDSLALDALIGATFAFAGVFGGGKKSNRRKYGE
jgi:hypothetical protein